MKQSAKILILALCLVLLVSASAMPAAASSEVPYQTYTYDKWGNATPAPNGYLPTRSIGGAQLGCGNFSSASEISPVSWPISPMIHKIHIYPGG